MYKIKTIDPGYFNKTKCKKTSFIINDLEVSYKGKIKVTDNDEDIKSISPGGFLKISNRTFGNRRTVIIMSDSDGKLTREYYIGKNLQEWEPEGRIWLAENLIDVLRSTGIDAEGRTRRIYKSDGVDGVVDEISSISSNSVIKKYFEALLDIDGISDGDKSKIIEEICMTMTSNSQISSLLRKYDEIYMKNNKLAHAYFNCVSQLSSNTETGIVLRHVLENNQLTNEMKVYLLNCVDYMTSNTEMSLVLKEFNNYFPEDNDVSDAYFNAIDNMTSNTSISVTLIDLMDKHKLREYDQIKLLLVTSHLSSNTSMFEVLRKYNYSFTNNNNIAGTYFRTLNSFTSNTDLSGVMRDLLNKQTLTDISMMKFLRTARNFTSNTDMSMVLTSSIKYLNLENQAVMTEFFSTVEGFTSNTDMASVLRRLIDRKDLTKENIIDILKICNYFTSNVEMEHVMIKLSKHIDNDDETLKEIYINTAQMLTSQTSYKNVMDALSEK
jgi:hypothetical protein